MTDLQKEFEAETGFASGINLDSNSPVYFRHYVKWLESKAEADKWISVKDRLPDIGEKVLVVLDYSEHGRGKRIDVASTHFTAGVQRYGGPNALTGSGTLSGFYFAIPAIVHPETVTHWMPLPSPPKQ